MPTVHYLNVKQGDCSIIQHVSGHVSVIDLCNAKPLGTPQQEGFARALEKMIREKVAGNFDQKDHPVNPIRYLTDQGISSVFRFILTNPDMDHMDGLKAFFESFAPVNFWDTNNKAQKTFEVGSPYSPEDWAYYKWLRLKDPNAGPTRLTLYSNSSGQYYNVGADGSVGGDGLHILAPTPELLAQAIERDDYNDASYVILYRTSERTILFAGDSHDDTWEHILRVHRTSVQDVDLLIAPHHGRHSDRSFTFLDIVKPKMTLFGNAPSEHLAYNAWSSRGLPVITNNQAGSVVIDISESGMSLWATHKPYAEKVYPQTFYSERLRAYYLGTI